MKKRNSVENGVVPTRIQTITEIESDKANPLEPEFMDPKKKSDVPPVSFFSLFRYVKGSDKILITIGILSSIVTGVCQPLNTLIFGTLTGNMIEHAFNMQNASIRVHELEALMDDIKEFAMYNSFIGLGMLIFSFISIVTFSYSALQQIFRIRGLFFKKTMDQDISWYDVNQSGDFTSRMSEDLTKLEEGIGEKVPMFVHYQVAFVGSLILAFVKGWELTLICLTSLPVTMISIGIVSRFTSKLARQEMSAYGIAGAIAEEVISSIRTVIAFGGQPKEIERYNSRLTLARDVNIKRSFFSGVGFGMLWFFIYGSYALAFWYGVKLIIDEIDIPASQRTYDPGTMVTVFFSVMMGSMNFGIASPYIEAFGIASGAGAKVFNVINNIPFINSFKNKGDKLENVKGKITFNDVHFNYPSRKDVTVLSGFNLTINPGETVALVGSSGCGKSTCIQLLQRFYDPESGTVELDGKDIRDIDLISLRSNIGVVGQEPVLFGTTIAENIKFGNRSANMDDVERAAKKANAHDFIMKLPLGYNTLVGERGAQLSGGQKQRIAIARALVRDPAILLLDEATSALDTNSEAKVQAAIDKASKGCTTIVVAHRLSTVRNADKIVVVSKGKVVEQGKHNELMKLEGEYFKLVTTQVAVDQTVEDSPEQASLLQRTISVTSADSADSDLRKASISVRGEAVEPVEKEEISLVQIIRKNQPEWMNITIGSLSSVIMGASMPVFAILFGDILGVLSGNSTTEIRSEANKYCILFAVAGVITGIATFLQIWNFGIAGERLTMRLRKEIFEAMLKQEVAYFDDRENSTGSLCARLSTEAANVQGATGQRIGTILQSISTLCLSIGFSMYYQWKLGFVAMAFAPLILIATFLQGRLIKHANFKHQKNLENASKIAVEAVSNIRTVASLGCEDVFYQIYMSELTPGYQIAKRGVYFRGLVFGMARSLMFFAYAACMYYGGVLMKDGETTYTEVIKVSQSLIMGTVSIANALAFAPNLQKGLESAAKIFKLLHRTPAILDSPIAVDKDWKTGNIDYTDIGFYYPTRAEVRVLRGLNLTIERGNTVALVGPSGCGKSTIVQLLERFYDPDSGTITIDKENIKNIKLARLRSQMGIVSQEPVLFDRTIEENIAYGDNTRNVPKAEIMEAAKKANIHNFIVSLPMGYDTRLGDKGTQLSGGQKQRVAIARALIRDPKILLLDEATSALDTESEKVVQEALDKAKEGRTCITIAHRLSTIQDADVICVVNKGRIAEQGTHSQLLSQRGLYYRLHRLQK